jgi:protein-tyrosine phosphatase
MLKKVSIPVLSLLLLSFCTQEKPSIRVACEAMPSGSYMIKWETFPPIAGTVKIYESNNPDSFNLYSPIVETEISKGFIEFVLLGTNRSYFKLVFNKKYSEITAERIIPTSNLFNFRDLGGYYNINNKQTHWGKLYRSSSLGEANKTDKKIMDRLGIKTVIDFRSDKGRYENPNKYSASQVFNLPLRSNPSMFSLDKILAGKMKRIDALIYQQDVTAYLLDLNYDYYIKLFDILLNEDNYPIVMNCDWGKDKSGVASALILSALDVEWEQIVEDFVLSDELIPYFSLVTNLAYFPDEVQETMTAMMRTHKEVINYVFEKEIKDYGSINKFLEQELNLTYKKKEKLKEILLYQDIN